MKRTFKILLFIGILLTGFGALAIYWTFYRPLPDYSTRLELSQLHQPVNIKWDDYGVPHIYASNKHDLYMAVGYVHAQDRLWQMTVTQMAAQGRFAEFLGKELLPLDKLQRTIGFWRIAQKMEAQLLDSTRHVLEAYAQGVNQYVAQHKKELPVQFSLVGMEPIAWTPTHSLALARLMAWELNISWKTELTYSMLLEKLGSSQFQELFPDSRVTSGLEISALNDSTALSSLALPLLNQYQNYQKMMATEGLTAGSNAWAVAGSRTQSGKPLLAGDPHLGLSIPGKWYEVHLNLNGKNLSGATLPGAPSVILGQNDFLAWSLTNVMLDDTDFFEEQIDPQDSNQYLLDTLGGEPVYEKFTFQRDIIKIKNENDTTFTRRLSKHGPIISDLYPQQNLTKGKTISMQWTGQTPSHELEALQSMGWAGSFDTFKNSLKKFKVPAQNLIYADTTGNIGLFTLADIPIRSGNPLVIRPGWQPAYDWQGTVPYQELPKIINPQKGWVANANNRVAGDRYPYYMSVYWQPDSRYKRIEQYLSDNDQLSPQAFQVMQFDTYSFYAREITNLILPILKNNSDSTFATPLNYLENWNFKYETSETAASIMDVFLLRLAANTFEDEMGTAMYEEFVTYSGKPYRILTTMLEDDATFFDDITTPAVETKKDIVQESMRQALSFLRDNFGKEPSEWHWGNLHTIRLKPALFGRIADQDDAPAILKLIVDNIFSKGPYPAPGHAMSINNGEYLWNAPYNMVLGPSIRRIIDLSDTHQSLSIIPGGQSGNPFSDFYGDQTNNWLNGQYKFLYQDSSRFTDYETMQLLPEK